MLSLYVCILETLIVYNVSSISRFGSIMTNKILIVEDNDLNQKLFQDLLEAKGYVVFNVMDGALAIDAVHNIKPDLIVMDIQLPNISGIDLTKWIKQDPNTAHIPILAVTAFAMRRDEKRVLDSGCDAYMSKPISITPFLQKISELIEKS